MNQIVISLGRASDLARITKVVECEWPAFVRFLSRPPKATTDKASPGWYCPARFEPAHRHGDNFVARYCLTFDYDAITPDDLKLLRRAFKQTEHVLYTTWSHTIEAPRVRMVLPLSRECTAQEFSCITRAVGARFDLDKLARESDKPAQMMFLPSKQESGEYWFEHVKGDLIDVDFELEAFDDWTDPTQWPRRSERDAAHAVGELTPPNEKPGLVGAFCRLFDIHHAIERFELPYAPGSTGDRYTYTEGSRPDGLRIYDHGLKAHSDHDTDPAHGQHNAFDLVRLHRFADLDDGKEYVDILEAPSYRAMCEFVLELPEYQRERLSEFEDLGEEDEAAPDDSKPSRFTVVPAPEYSHGEQMAWLIKNTLPKGELAVVYGESGSGKSFLVFDLCAAVALGKDWQSKKTEKAKVVYVCAEGARGFRQRIQAYSRQNDVSLDDLGVVSDAPNMLEVKDVAAMTAAINQFGPVDMVVIDTLAASMPGGDENAGKDLGKVVDHCKKIHKYTGALVVLVHHSGKDASRGARGWSGLRAAADAEIEITRSGDMRVMTLTKMKDGDDGARWGFVLRTIVLGQDADGEEITSCVVEYIDKHIAPEGRPPEPQGMYAKNLLAVARSVLRGRNSIEPDVLLAQAVDKLPQVEKGKRDTRRQQSARALQKLVVDGFLYKHNDDTVSLTTAETADEKEWFDE